MDDVLWFTEWPNKNCYLDTIIVFLRLKLVYDDSFDQVVAVNRIPFENSLKPNDLNRISVHLTAKS